MQGNALDEDLYDGWGADRDTIHDGDDAGPPTARVNVPVVRREPLTTTRLSTVPRPTPRNR